jgi:alanine racemase
MTRPIWAEISKTRLTENFAALTRQSAGRATLLCVVKANAYGHGEEATARILVEAGARWLGVTSVEEGVALRAALPEVNILVLAGIALSAAGEAEAGALLAHRLIPVIWDSAQLNWLAQAAKENQAAIPVHLEIETGMGRQGVPWNEIRPETAAIDSILQHFQPNSPLQLHGVMTHFASPERFKDRMNQLQTDRFVQVLETLRTRKMSPKIIHAGNGDTLFDELQMERLHALALNHRAELMLRPGLALFGGAADSAARGLAPALTWKTRVISLRTIQAGDTVGYGSTFTATRPTKIALVGAGYADGLSRSLSNRGAMLVGGRRASIVGRISMDLATLDVTNIPAVVPGDEVVIIGQQGNETITAAAIAALMNTIPYEVLCGIANRVPRIVVD